MKMKEIKQENRPREKLIKYGVKTLSNEELLAILIKSGTKTESALELAIKIINSVDNISLLNDINYHQLCKISGIKDSKACTIVAAFEFTKRVFTFKEDKITFEVAKEIYDYMKPILTLETKEVFYALYLDVKCRLIQKVMICEGTLTSVLFDTKKVLSLGLKNNCYSIVLVHNHPFGNSIPSKNDIDLTIEFFKASQLFNICLLDHIIIAEDDYSSMSAMNIIN